MMALLRTIDNDDDIDEDEDDDDDEKGNSPPSIVTSRSQLQFQRSKKLHLIRICI